MKSNLHKQAVALVKELYPTVKIIEEYPIKVDRTTLYVDIFIPLLKLAIEVHGEQHYEMNSFYHNSKAEFYAQKKRDNDKLNYLNEAGYTVKILPYNEIDKWKQILQKTK